MDPRAMTDVEQRMTDDRDWAVVEQRMMSDLDWAVEAPEVQENPDHYGKSVVVYNKRILAAGKDSPALREQAARLAGVPWQELVVVEVDRPGLWEIPH